MSDVKTWDPAASGNTSAPPDGWPENQDRTSVNNCARELMAAIRRWYNDPEWLQLYNGFTVGRDAYNVVRITGVDATADCITGRRVFLSGGSDVYATIVSASYAAGDTTITLDVDPGLGTDELASGVDLTFADVDPDTITAASGTPFGSLVADDRVRVEWSASNNATFRVASATATEITLEASETLTGEGPVAAKIYHEHGVVPAANDTILFHHTRQVRGPAFRSIGVGDGDIPTISHLGTHVRKAEGAGGGIDADKLDGLHVSEILGNAQGGNLIINSEFRRWQEGGSASGVADTHYVCDQWKNLSEASSAAQMVQETGSGGTPTTAWSSIKITQNTAHADEKWMIYQCIEGRESVGARGKPVSLSFQAKLGTGFTSPSSLRFGIFEWDGTVDAPTADPISAWPAAGADPTLVVSASLSGGTSQVLSAGNWVECKLENVTVNAASTNIGVMIWSDDDTIAVGDIVYISQVKLEIGDQATDYVAESEHELIARTDRFFCKTFPEDVVPDDYASSFPGALGAWAAGTGSEDAGVYWEFPQRMHSTPTVDTYNPGDATPGGDGWRDEPAGTNESDLVQWRCDRSCAIFVSSTMSVVGNNLWIHATADARFF